MFCTIRTLSSRPSGTAIPFCFCVPALKRRPIIREPLRGAWAQATPFQRLKGTSIVSSWEGGAGGDPRATMCDGRPCPSDCRKRLGNWPNSRGQPRGGEIHRQSVSELGWKQSNTLLKYCSEALSVLIPVFPQSSPYLGK